MQAAHVARRSTAPEPAPTPEPLRHSTRALGGREIWIKLTGLTGGGDKARKLELLVADALSQGCDTRAARGAAEQRVAGDGGSPVLYAYADVLRGGA